MASPAAKPKHITFEITAETESLRLDKALTLHPEIESRSQVTRLIESGHVTLNGTPVKASLKVSLGQKFVIEIPPPVSADLSPLDLKLNIVFEDEHVIVIDKPPGLVVHPAAGHFEDTLVNALLHHTNQLSSGFEANRPGIVHRLDKDTSGLIVVAKNDSAHRHLAKQFKNKTAHRIYWALAYGKFKDSRGRIESYLQRHPRDRKKFASERVTAGVAPSGKIAITHYEVKKVHESGLTLVHLKLETGRTHQIRVHLSEMNHSLVADPIYGSSGRVNSLRDAKIKKIVSQIPRLCLHAAELGFTHPVSDKMMMFKSSWPEDLTPSLQQLGFL